MSSALAEVDEAKQFEVVSSTALGDITRAEIDIQIATAKRYPRSVGKAITAATTLATMNQEIAAACMYAVPRDKKMITGPSVRLAEIVASTWGNLRFGARVIGDDGRFITVQGFAHDLEVNTAFAFELKARVTYKNGGRYSDDMIGVTANAASSKALRNAVFRVVPKVIVEQIAAAARKVAVGDVKTLAERRGKAIEHFNKMGVPTERILALFDKPTVADLDQDDLLHMVAIATAIKDGETTVDAAFPEEKKETRTDKLAENLPVAANGKPTGPANVVAKEPTKPAASAEEPVQQQQAKPLAEGELSPVALAAIDLEEAETTEQVEASYKAAMANPAIKKGDRPGLTRLKDERLAAVAASGKLYGDANDVVQNLR